MLDDDLGHTLDDIIAIDLVVVESMAAIANLEVKVKSDVSYLNDDR